MEAYQKLERELGKWNAYPDGHTVVCSSGTTALQLALETFPIKKGSKVFLPDYTMIACARAVTMAGLDPVFVDCDERMLMWPQSLAKAITKHCAGNYTGNAIMAVHIYGRLCHMDAIHSIASQHGMFVIEDLAEAHCALPHSQTDAACWSFYRNKIVAGEEGGCVSFHRSSDAARARQLRCLGFTEDHDFIHIPGGMNAKLSNANANLILKSLASVTENVTRRLALYNNYLKLIDKKFVYPITIPNSPWVFTLRLPNRDIQNGIVAGLKNHASGIRYGFKPMTMQPEYLHKDIGNSNAKALANLVLYLSLDPERITEKIQEEAAAVINALA